LELKDDANLKTYQRTLVKLNLCGAMMKDPVSVNDGIMRNMMNRENDVRVV